MAGAFLRRQQGGVLLLFASSAFGMGVNVPDITRLWHFEPPQDLDDYVQQIGRAARDATSTAVATLYYSGNGLRDCSAQMKLFIKTEDTCRHAIITAHFQFPPQGAANARCCDNCEKKNAAA